MEKVSAKNSHDMGNGTSQKMEEEVSPKKKKRGEKADKGEKEGKGNKKVESVRKIFLNAE